MFQPLATFSELNRTNLNPEFVEFRETNTKLLLRIILLVSIVLTGSWFFLDTQLGFTQCMELTLLRLLFIALMLLFFGFSYAFTSRKAVKFLLVVFFYSEALVSSCETLLTGGITGPYAESLTFMLIAWLAIIPFSYVELILYSISFVLIHNTIAYFGGDRQNFDWMKLMEVDFVLFGAVFLGGVVAFINNHYRAKVFMNERKIRKNEEMFRMINENMQDVLWTLDFRTKRFTYISPSVINLTGYPTSELLGKGIDTLLTMHSMGKFNIYTDKFSQEFLKGNRQARLEGEFELRTRDGQTRWVEIVASFIAGSGGDIIEILGDTRDIQDRRAAEHALRESEEKYRMLINRASDGIIITQDGKFCLVNRSFCEMSGYTEDELMGMDFIHLVEQSDRERLTGYHNRRMSGERFPLVYTTRAVKKNGEVIHMELNSTTIEFNNRSAAFIITRDLTYRIKMEEALRKSEERNRMLVQSLQEGLFVIRDGRFVFLNNAIVEIVGYSVEELLGQSFLTVIDPEYHQAVTENYRRRVAGEDAPGSYEAVLICKDKTCRVPVILSVTLADYDGEPAVIGTAKDVSLLKNTEKVLRDREQRLNAILESALVGIALADRNGKMLHANKTWLQMFGYPEEVMLQMTSKDISHPDDFDITDESYHKLLRGEINQYQFEKRYIRNDKSVFWGNLSVTTIRNEKDEVEAIIAIILDINNRKIAEEELRKAHEQLKTETLQLQRENLKSQFETLKNQVNPHFLFNSLNVLTSLIRLDPVLAEKFTEQMSKVYRYVLEHKEEDLVSLRTEAEFIRAYVFLLEIRFRDKLRVNISIPEEKMECSVPPLAIQLLIENAVKHNTFSRKTPLVIEIFTDDENYLNVVNNYQKRDMKIESTGVGLINISRRFRHLTDRITFFGVVGEQFQAKIPLI